MPGCDSRVGDQKSDLKWRTPSRTGPTNLLVLGIEYVI